MRERERERWRYEKDVTTNEKEKSTPHHPLYIARHSTPENHRDRETHRDK